MYQHWSDDEITELIRHYSRQGPARIAKRLGRSESAVRRVARRHGLRFGLIDGWVRVGTLARVLGMQRIVLSRAAKHAGVLKQDKARKLALVPEKWADAYAQRRDDLLEAEEARAAGYLTCKQAAKVLGCDSTTVRKAVVSNYGRLAPYMQGVRYVLGMGNAYLFNPYDVEDARRAFERDNCVRGMIPLQNVALESPTSYRNIYARAKRRGLLRYGIRGGVKTAYVPADRIPDVTGQAAT